MKKALVVGVIYAVTILFQTSVFAAPVVIEHDKYEERIATIKHSCIASETEKDREDLLALRDRKEKQFQRIVAMERKGKVRILRTGEKVLVQIHPAQNIILMKLVQVRTLDNFKLWWVASADLEIQKE